MYSVWLLLYIEYSFPCLFLYSKELGKLTIFNVSKSFTPFNLKAYSHISCWFYAGFFFFWFLSAIVCIQQEKDSWRKTPSFLHVSELLKAHAHTAQLQVWQINDRNKICVASNPYTHDYQQMFRYSVCNHWPLLYMRSTVNLNVMAVHSFIQN